LQANHRRKSKDYDDRVVAEFAIGPPRRVELGSNLMARQVEVQEAMSAFRRIMSVIAQNPTLPGRPTFVSTSLIPDMALGACVWNILHAAI
jgi:hypothetical protein